jgi:CheY-like chemotaxis protein
LINDILDLAKVEVGKLEIDFAPVPLSGLCDASLLLVREMATKKQVSLALSLDDEHAILLADARRIKQILVNLLSNAVKFTPPGGNVRLAVSARRAQHEVRFAVQDDGIGIAPDKLGQLFKPFTQLDTGLARQYEGAGLGLALVHRLVELHGGSVCAESAGIPGQGSCFTVTLPWREPCRAAAWAPSTDLKITAEPAEAKSDSTLAPDFAAASAAHARAAPGQMPKAKILIAEDNQLSLQALGEYLSEVGYQLTLTSNGAEALESARAVEPDLILMDVQMPVMDGLEAIRRLRADSRCSTVRIVALTALAMAGDRERCLAAGADDYVSKPFLLKDLEAKVEAMLLN